MKIVCLIIALFALSFTASAQKEPTYSAQSLTIPTVTAGSTSNSIGAVIDCRKQQNVVLQWNVGGASPTFLVGTNVAVSIAASVDGLTYDTNHFTFNVTNKNILVTNLSVQGIGYLRVDSVTANGLVATNLVKYGIKIQSP